MARATPSQAIRIATLLAAVSVCGHARIGSAEPTREDNAAPARDSAELVGRFQTADEPRDTIALGAVFDPATHSLSGTLRMRWTNRGATPARHLWWHLYLNAFANEETRFFRDGGGSIRGSRVRAPGGVSVQTMRVSGHDVWPSAHFPDDTDRTEVRVALPAPIAAGASAEIEVTFESTLPQAVARTGYAGDFNVVAQWFPKLARREPDGTWAHFPLEGVSEFYADFSDYSLSVRTPVGFVTVANGQSIGAEITTDSVTSRFVADAVHDSIFVVAPEADLLRLGPEPGDGGDGDIRVTVWYPPGYESAAAHHLDVAQAGLAHFGRRFFPYPYDEIQVVVPPSIAAATMGMEYPRLFLTAGWRRPIHGLAAFGLDGATTAHELAHQWFQGMVATNENRWPMLDEGLTSWATEDLMRTLHGPGRSGIDLPWLGLHASGFEVARSRLGRGTPGPSSRPAREFRGKEYAQRVYTAVPLLLETIGRTWGPERLHRGLRAYAQRHRFAHPGPEDFYQAMESELGTWVTRGVLQRGLEEGCDARVEVQALEPVEGGVRVGASRRGCLPVPIWVELQFDDGSAERVAWAGAEGAFEHTVLERGKRLVEVVLDPDHHNLTDPVRANDHMRTRYGLDTPRPGAATHEDTWAARAFALAQLLLSGVGP